MRKNLMAGAILGLALSMPAVATPPSVSVDIAPLHSLVSQVMTGVNQPSLIIPAEASPHDYSLRPSQAQALAASNVVFWMGKDLTPWLEKTLDNVSESAQKIEMLKVAGITKYEFREGATFEEHAHHDEEGHHDEHGHEDHGHENHDEHGHEDHGHENHDEHGHEGADPHAWLDPENAKVWVSKIQTVLSEKDPANAAQYKANADKALAELDALIAATQTQIKALGDLKFIVFHDAYQYFEKRFGISASGSISLSDAEEPSPKRISEIRDTVKKLGVNCVFAEPQYDAGLVNNVFEGSVVSNVGIMDPLGASIDEGSEHYTQLIQGMVSSLSACTKS